MPNLYHGADETGDWVKITSYKGYYYYNYLDDDDKKLIDMDLSLLPNTNSITAIFTDALVLRQNQLILYMRTGVPPPPKQNDKSIWDEIADDFTDVGNTIADGVVGAANKVKDVGEDAFDKIKTVAKGLLKKLVGGKNPPDDDQTNDTTMYLLLIGGGLLAVLLLLTVLKMLF